MTQFNVFTIGFTKSNAEHFFSRLRNAGIAVVCDVRLHRTSQLSGFAKEVDLKYFLRELAGIEYFHQPLLAPTDDMLKSYKNTRGSWSVYQEQFLALMEDRRIETQLSPQMFERSCLLCSEATPHYCHRRLVVEYLNRKWNSILRVEHL